MAKQKSRIQQADVVRSFAVRLRELRNSRGFTQIELARKAKMTANYVGRLESGAIAPGIDLVDRLATVLGVSIAELLRGNTAPDAMGVLQGQAEGLFAAVMKLADRETLAMLNPLLSHLHENLSRR